MKFLPFSALSAASPVPKKWESPLDETRKETSMRNTQLLGQLSLRKRRPPRILGTPGMFGDIPKLLPDGAKEGIGISRNSNTSEKSKPQKRPRTFCPSSKFLLSKRRDLIQDIKNVFRKLMFSFPIPLLPPTTEFLSPLAPPRDVLLSLYLPCFGVFCSLSNAPVKIK